MNIEDASFIKTEEDLVIFKQLLQQIKTSILIFETFCSRFEVKSIITKPLPENQVVVQQPLVDKKTINPNKAYILKHHLEKTPEQIAEILNLKVASVKIYYKDLGLKINPINKKFSKNVLNKEDSLEDQRRKRLEFIRINAKNCTYQQLANKCRVSRQTIIKICAKENIRVVNTRGKRNKKEVKTNLTPIENYEPTVVAEESSQTPIITIEKKRFKPKEDIRKSRRQAEHIVSKGLFSGINRSNSNLLENYL